MTKQGEVQIRSFCITSLKNFAIIALILSLKSGAVHKNLGFGTSLYGSLVKCEEAKPIKERYVSQINFLRTEINLQ